MRKPDRGRHQARKRAVDLLFEAEARGITPAEAAQSREGLAQSQSDVSALNPYTVTVARGVTQHAAHIDDHVISRQRQHRCAVVPRSDPSGAERHRCCRVAFRRFGDDVLLRKAMEQIANSFLLFDIRQNERAVRRHQASCRPARHP